MSAISIGKNMTDTEMTLNLPTVMVMAGDKMSGKTFFLRNLILRRPDTGRTIVITNKPETYHGLDETFIHLSYDHADFNITEPLTIIDGLALYDYDPDRILDKVITSFGEKVREGDFILIDEAYPYLTEESSKNALLKTIEEAWKKGATVIVSTNQTQTLMDEADVLFELSEYCLVLKQSQENAERMAERFGGDRGKYEIRRIYDTMEFGKGLFMRQDGDMDYLIIG